MHQQQLFPTSPGPTFDAERGESEKRRGMEIAARSKQERLKWVRRCAENLANKNGFCHADMLAEYLAHRFKLDMHDLLGNAAGSIFAGREWEFTGRRIKSTRVRSHGNELKVWRLRDG